MQVDVIETPELGDRSYLVHDGVRALVVDPQRDIDRVLARAADLGVQIALVVETHIHNDYVTGGFQLAQVTGARYAVSAEDEVDFARVAVADGDVLTVGSLQVQVLATPGHTDHHVSYLVTDTAMPEHPPAAFTGGSLLYGSVGRTDLLGAAHTHELTHAQYHSAHRLAEVLPDAAPVYPTHGFGSFCSSGATAGGQSSTIGAERTRNDALTAPDPDAFVARLIANLTVYPSYYVHMAGRNRGGPEPVDLDVPALSDGTEIAKRIHAGEWVVDLRDRVAYAADHARGTLGIALGPQFATYLGWLIPWGTPLTLLGGDPDDLAAAQRQLVRIGIDRPDAAALDQPGCDRAGYPRVDFVQARLQMGRDDVLLDVRRDDEWAARHIDGGAHRHLASLLEHLAQLPAGRLWIHCASGYRASIAASLLSRSGRDVVYIDDDFGNAEAAGWPLVPA